MRRSLGLTIALVGALAGATPTVATAQPAPPAPGAAATAAREHATQAKAEFDRGDYVAAIANYREAYRLLPTPGLLYNLAQAYRLAGDCPNAAAMYRDYLRLVPDSPYRATAEQNLAAAEACATSAAEPAGPAEPAEPAEPAAPEPAPPAPVPVEVAPAAPPAAPAAPPRFRQAALITGGAGVVLLAAGAFFAVDASRAATEVGDFYAAGGSWDQIADVDARGHRSRTLAIVGLTGGGVALAAGAGLYWLGRGAEARRVVVAPGRSRTDVVVTWRF